MRKRIKGLFALCLAFCIALLGTPCGQVYAEGKEYKFMDGKIWEDVEGKNEEITELFAGDTLLAGFTGGFVVFDSNTERVLTTANANKLGVPSYYDAGNGNYAQDENYCYFAEQDPNPQQYVVPVPGPGYHGYRFDRVVDTRNATFPDKQYRTYYGTLNSEWGIVRSISFIWTQSRIPIPFGSTPTEAREVWRTSYLHMMMTLRR